MDFKHRQTQSKLCQICGGLDGHAPVCEKGDLEKLLDRNMYMSCPKCEKRQVGLNASDYFECRACRIQFSLSSVTDCEDPETVTFLDRNGNALITAFVLGSKGDGKFPMDESIKKLKQRIARKCRTSTNRER